MPYQTVHVYESPTNLPKYYISTKEMAVSYIFFFELIDYHPENDSLFEISLYHL